MLRPIIATQHKPVSVPGRRDKSPRRRPTQTNATAKGRCRKGLRMTKTSSDETRKAYAKGFEDAADMGKQALDAMVINADLAAKSYGAVSESWLQFAQAQIEDGMVAAKALSGCKTPKDAADLQSGYAKSAFEKYVAKISETQEISSGAANRMQTPFTNGFGSAVEKFWSTKTAV